jgi:hypothetical protein
MLPLWICNYSEGLMNYYQTFSFMYHVLGLPSRNFENTPIVKGKMFPVLIN